MTDAPAGPSRDGDDAGPDPVLDDLRVRLEELDDLPIGERVEQLRTVNDRLAAELAALDEL